MKTTLLAALLLAGLPFGALAQAPDAPAPAAEVLAPQIVCAETVFDFGERDNAGFVEHDFPIRNAGTLPLEIRNVRASCGCTAVKPSRNVVQPGDSAAISARFDLRGRNGMQTKTITVTSNDPEKPDLVLQLKGTAMQALRAQPSTLFFGRLEAGASRSRTFDVVSARGPIQIVSSRTDNPGLVLKPVPIDPPGDGSVHRFELTLDASLPEGNVSGSAFVKTDKADQPELALPVAAFLVAPPPRPRRRRRPRPARSPAS